MTKRFLSPEYYDEHGNPRGFSLFWFSCFFVTRSWLFFIMAGVTQNQGTALLTLFYADKNVLYLALITSFPVILLMFFSGALHKLPRFVMHYWRIGKWVLLAVLCSDIYFQIQFLIKSHWQFHFSLALILVVSCWLGCYLLRSQRIAWFFRTVQ